VVDAHLLNNEVLQTLKAFSAGIHPCVIEAERLSEQVQSFYKRSSLPSCKAIGECGLDRIKGPALQVQKSVFETQIAHAIDLKKPVIVHCVRAFDALLPILKKFQKHTTLIIHGFNSNEQIAAALLQNGAMLSFGASLINANNLRLKKIFSQTPPEKMFLENDGATVEIETIYRAAAEIKKCDLHVLKEIIFANYNKIFSNE
jgi:TatD DNase family protein